MAKGGKQSTTRNRMLTALVANADGEILELPGYGALGMGGSDCTPLRFEDTRNMPFGSELLYLPDRYPVLFNLASGQTEALKENPYLPGERIYPVAAFNSPGYVLSAVCAYRETRQARILPLFSYGALGVYRGRFRVAAILVDAERRQDLRLMRKKDVYAGIQEMRKKLGSNRLRSHLEQCALTYGCPAGKNFFLGRYEAPLPTARYCNAQCLGCLSKQRNTGIPQSQHRIAFTPTPSEIAEVALAHLQHVRRAVVSFGQGCEGDPLMAVEAIEPAIRRIRSRTGKGTINMNTNASRPDRLQRLLDAGLDSVRVSLNSTRKACYHAYFKPKGYQFSDVLQSIRIALQKGKHVSLNYLNVPGFTDSPQEKEALLHFLDRYPVHMIQWRNLNYDPVRYWRKMNAIIPHDRPLGVRYLLDSVRRAFPHIKFGYFNPPKEKFQIIGGQRRSPGVPVVGRGAG